MSDSRGFTLFETLMVLMVAGVLFLASVPPIGRAREALRFSGLAHQIRSELHHARIQSITRGEDCRFRVVSVSTYRVECQTPDWETIGAGTVPPGYEISATSRPEFHPLGNVGPMGTIRIRNEGGDEKRLIVSRSGRIRTE